MTGTAAAELEARLRKIGDEAEGTWTVPFIVEEKRIPKVRADALLKTPLNLNRVALGSYLRRMYHAGYWPDAFRVQVMVEPRPGESLEDRISDKTLPVAWKAASARE